MTAPAAFSATVVAERVTAVGALLTGFATGVSAGESLEKAPLPAAKATMPSASRLPINGSEVVAALAPDPASVVTPV